jgi:branched-chain amino acid transport system permease protein
MRQAAIAGPKPVAVSRSPAWLGLLLFVLILAAAGAAPIVLPPFTIHLLALVLCYGTWAMSFGLVMGQLGLTSFGHAALFGGGAYAAAWVALNLSDNLFAGLAAGGLFGAATGGVLGLVLGRLAGVAFSIGSLAFGGMVGQVTNSWTEVTGGSDGLVGLPFPRLFGHDLDDRALYWTAAALAAVTYFLLRTVLARRTGLLLHAVRDNPARATASGISVQAVRIAALAGSGLLAGLAGGVSAFIVGSVAPSSLDWSASGTVLVMAVLGGVGTVAGPLLGAAGYTLLEQALSQVFPNYRLLLGLAFIAVVVLAPGGLRARRVT